MTCGSYLIEKLHQHGFRMTPQRMAILHTLHHAGGHISPTEVFERTRHDQPGLTETTVYRTLEFLVKNGYAQVAHMGSGKLIYELTEHLHHHLICRGCGREVAVDHSIFAPLYRQIMSATGYKLDSSHVTLFGSCPDCQKLSEKED